MINYSSGCNLLLKIDLCVQFGEVKAHLSLCVQL